jgi:ketosteroid isomerase-like protein
MATAPAQVEGALAQMLDALERGEVDAAWKAIAGVCAEDIVFTSMVGNAVEGRAYEGPAGIREWFEDLTGSFDVAYRNRRFLSGAEEELVFLADLTLRGRASDAELTQEIAIVAEPGEDGRMLRARTFGRHAAALEQAGLSQ